MTIERWVRETDWLLRNCGLPCRPRWPEPIVLQARGEYGARAPGPKPEEWVRYDTVRLNADELPGWFEENDRAFRENPTVIAIAKRAAERAARAVFLDAIPPDGRSTSDRCALARESSDS